MCKLKIGVILLFMIVTAGIYSQDEMMQRGIIPDELLRPRREEAPRYPIDMVIGPLGQGQASPDAYQFARSIATALLAGNTNASSFSTANKMLVENSMSALNAVSPRYFRLGSGRTEPDGSVSFLIRFAGREEGIIGELFIRFVERPRPAPEPQPAEETPSPEVTSSEEKAEGNDPEEAVVQAPPPPPPPPPPPLRVWIFEDLIFEEPRSREEENRASRQRYDFSPYERFF